MFDNIRIDGFCIGNDEFCTNNDEFCITNAAQRARFVYGAADVQVKKPGQRRVKSIMNFVLK